MARCAATQQRADKVQTDAAAAAVPLAGSVGRGRKATGILSSWRWAL